MYSVDEDEAIEYFQSLKIICPEMFRSTFLPVWNTWAYILKQEVFPFPVNIDLCMS